MENPRNHLLLVRDADAEGWVLGCFLFEETAPNVYEVHTMLLKECRGVWAIIAGRLAAKHMIQEVGAEKLVSQCPMNHREILFFALRCGFHRTGEAALNWLKDGIKWPLQQVELTRKDFDVCQTI